MFTLKKQQEIHFSHFVLQSAMHAARGSLPLIQLMSAHRVEICWVLYRAYFTNTLYILPSAYIAICTPWLSHAYITHTLYAQNLHICCMCWWNQKTCTHRMHKFSDTFRQLYYIRHKIAHLSTSGFLSSIVSLWYLSLCSRNLLLVVNFFLHWVQS